jgi:GT2 family glycosyltransferase
MIKLAIIVINYRTPKLVIDCLQSLVTEIDFAQHQVVIVDNKSGDDSVEILENAIAENQWQSWVQLITSPVNGGFSAGNNLGLKAIEAEGYLLLNSDTIVRKDAIKILLKNFDANPKIGIFSPRLEWLDEIPQISCFRYHNPFSELIDGAATSVITKIFNNFNVPLPVSDEPLKPQWTSFACVLIRRKVINDIGLMDEGYFMYYDDVDYCRQAQKAGWQILHLPSARVVHLRGGSSSTKTDVKQRKRPASYLYASRSRYYAKFYGILGLWFANFCWLLGRSIAKLREIINNKQPHTCEFQEQDIWLNCLNPLQTETINKKVIQEVSKEGKGLI